MKPRNRLTVLCLAVILLAFCLVVQSRGQVTGPAEVGYGELVKLTAEATGQTQWLPIQPVDLVYETAVDSVYFSSGCQPSVIILIASTVDFENRTSNLTRHIVTVGKGDDPEPDPPDPDPDPDKVSKVFAVVVEETSARTPATSKVLVPFVGALQGRGQRARVIDKDQQAEWITEFLAQSAVERAISDYGLPVMFLWDDTAGGSKKMLFAKPLPATIDEVLADVQEAIE